MEHWEFRGSKRNAICMNEHLSVSNRSQKSDQTWQYLYGLQLQAMGLPGGWPLNVFLMPNQKPFYAATYFPNTQWQKSASPNIAEHLRKHEESVAGKRRRLWQLIESQRDWKIWECCWSSGLDPYWTCRVIAKLSAQYWSGMGEWIRIPNSDACHWAFVLRLCTFSQENEELSRKVFFTLQKMEWVEFRSVKRVAFRVISVDGEWFAPHFEKMGY